MKSYEMYVQVISKLRLEHQKIKEQNRGTINKIPMAKNATLKLGCYNGIN